MPNPRRQSLRRIAAPAAAVAEIPTNTTTTIAPIAEASDHDDDDAIYDDHVGDYDDESDSDVSLLHIAYDEHSEEETDVQPETTTVLPKVAVEQQSAATAVVEVAATMTDVRPYKLSKIPDDVYFGEVNGK